MTDLMRSRRAETWADAVGNTPLVQLREASESTGALVLGKLEARSPGGSLKDRAVLQIVRAAERRGDLGPGGTLVVASAGNLGISTAMAAAAFGYAAIVAVPDEASAEYRRLLAGFGAEVVVTSGGDAMRGAVRAARDAVRAVPGRLLVNPLEDPAAQIGFEEMAQEIWDDLGGQVTVLLTGIGTGATAMGAARRLHALGSTRVIGVEPARAAVLTAHGGAPPRPHRIAGLGVGFVPPLLDRAVLDGVVAVEDEDALDTMFGLWVHEGLLVGPSSGATVQAAIRIARPGDVVVAVLADTGERHLALARVPARPDSPA